MRARFYLPFILVITSAFAQAPAQSARPAEKTTVAADSPRASVPHTAATPQSSGFHSLLQWADDHLNNGIAGNLIATAIIAMLGLWANHHRSRWKERRAALKPETIHLWNLIDEKSPKEGRAAALIRVMNHGALILADTRPGQAAANVAPTPHAPWLRVLWKVKPSPAKAARLWKREEKKLRDARHAFVPPACIIDDGMQHIESTNAMDVVTGWLQTGESGEEDVRRVAVRAPTGTGKTVFMLRLVLELSAESQRAHPAPMLAGAEMFKEQNDHIRNLLTSGAGPVRVFILAWLAYLKIQVPEKIREDLIEDFEAALHKGDIVLLLDGDDLLKQLTLDEFGKTLLKYLPSWVVTHHRDRELVKPDRRIIFEDAWDYARISDHIDQRWKTTGKVPVATYELVKRTIHDVLDRHRAAADRTGTGSALDGGEPYWLSHPRVLDLYLDAVEEKKLSTPEDIRRGAESLPILFNRIVDDAVESIGASESIAEIREALFTIAIADPTNPQRKDAGVPVIDAATSAHLKALTEIVRFSRDDERFSFRHASLRGYFISGHAARELADKLHQPKDTDELAREEPWSATKQAMVASWLKLNTKPKQHVIKWLKRDPQSSTRLKPEMRRNLLDLLISLELESVKDRRKIESLVDLDLTGIPGAHLDLRLMRPKGCDFRAAFLRDAVFAHATFERCDFRGATLEGVEALAANFVDCDFGQNEGKDAFANVSGMAIERAKFEEGGSPAPALRLFLENEGASDERSRYQGSFGRKFFESQQVFLGPGEKELEDDHYLPEILDAVQWWLRQESGPIYLVDLMAGGSYTRIAALREREEFKRLHILGVDRDPCAQVQDSRFRWELVEIGKQGKPGLDIVGLLRKAFGDSASNAHVIVAKKALHELDRKLQPLIIEECGRALMPGGRLILFEDTPGSESHVMDGKPLDEVVREIDTLRYTADGHGDGVLVDPDSEVADVRAALEKFTFDASTTGRIGFANTWVMVKDWANLNRREVRHRYFAAVMEISEWANGTIGRRCALHLNTYRLNPLIFNERGIQRVLDHLEREAPAGEERAALVERQESELAEWIWESDHLRVLTDFTSAQLKPNSPLANALGAKEESVSLDAIDPVLAPLNRPRNTAPTFNLPCAVLVFEKDRV